VDTSRSTDAYLLRIGATRPARPDAAALGDLQLRHLKSVPFENLSIHYGEDIVLTGEALTAKVVERRRGGFCYELNGAFAGLLRALGFRVTLLQARVLGADGRPGIPYDHLALLVGTTERDGSHRRLLADVGFGDHSHLPLDPDERGDQQDPAGTFRVVETRGEPDGGQEGDLDILRDGTPQYRIEPRPRVLADFEAGAWYHRTSPASHFTTSLVCSLLTDEGRITLSGDKLITTVHGDRQERQLTGDAEKLTVYESEFGLRLDRVPVIRPQLRNTL
jgi:N-hydroxyarylamine O-acetyltransferase